jgi:hypothetical protein
MADLTMCKGLGCERAPDCHRYTAVANEYRQSYFTRAPLNQFGECEYFVSNEGWTKSEWSQEQVEKNT